MILHENRLPADDSHEICLICYFRKDSKILNCCLLQIIGGALWVKADTCVMCILLTIIDVYSAHFFSVMPIRKILLITLANSLNPDQAQ